MTSSHTYSAYARGLEELGGTSYFVDLTALGRQEEWEEPAGRVTALGTPAGSRGSATTTSTTARGAWRRRRLDGWSLGYHPFEGSHSRSRLKPVSKSQLVFD
jgi:predicted dithiol-disulfide oxidoreductase (DUF899 family)